MCPMEAGSSFRSPFARRSAQAAFSASQRGSNAVLTATCLNNVDLINNDASYDRQTLGLFLSPPSLLLLGELISILNWTSYTPNTLTRGCSMYLHWIHSV
jgi:hypothetical protein